jgi:hypothetical protein
MLLDVIALKFDPVMVTAVPTGPDVGEKALMEGCAKQLNAKLINIKEKINRFLRVWFTGIGDNIRVWL